MSPCVRKLVVSLATGVLSAGTLADDVYPDYEPSRGIVGNIRISGDVADRDLIETLQRAFIRHQPTVTFRNSLHGPESTIAAVYTGTADLAFMAREIREPMERMAFEWAKLAKPYAVRYANAGFDRDRPATQLAVFVHKDNPLEALSLEQLDSVFGAEHKRGDHNARTWGDLGALGEWRTRPIQTYGTKVDSVASLFFRRMVMLDSRKWNPGLVEFVKPGEVLEALASDVSGIAFAPMAYKRPGTKSLAIAGPDGAGPVPLTRETAISIQYPLSRSVAIILHRPDNDELTPLVQEFLRFVLSDEGQQIVGQSGSYLALSGASVWSERHRLQ